jgi:hypothetical protein
MASRPTHEELGAVFAAGERLKARMPHASYAEQLDYLHWVGDVLARVVATSPSEERRREGRRELALLRAAQLRLAREAQEAAKAAAYRMVSEQRRTQVLEGGGTSG